MTNYSELAKKYIKAGFSVIPVSSNKTPSVREWGKYQIAKMSEEEADKHFNNVFGIALLGGTEKNITILDFDLKYSLRSDFFDNFKKALPVDLLQKMYVQSTMSGGYHFIFSCKKVENNMKLCSRYTTPYEKHETYLEAFNDPKTRDKALRIASNDMSRILIETRGNGGYALLSPSPGYKHVYGKIQEISIEEYDLLMETARSFSEVIEERKDIRLEKYNKEFEVSPFADFNERFDVISYLEDNGWEVMKGQGKSIRLKRAGNPSSGSSALFDTESRLMNVFSTSTIFDVGRAYSPADIFILLDCNNDTSLAFSKMVDLGYGKEK